MEKIRIIKNLFSLVSLSKQEKVMLLKDLMSDWQISEQDIAEAISAAPKRRGRPKKAEITEAAAPVPPDAPSQAEGTDLRSGRTK